MTLILRCLHVEIIFMKLILSQSGRSLVCHLPLRQTVFHVRIVVHFSYIRVKDSGYKVIFTVCECDTMPDCFCSRDIHYEKIFLYVYVLSKTRFVVWANSLYAKTEVNRLSTCTKSSNVCAYSIRLLSY